MITSLFCAHCFKVLTSEEQKYYHVICNECEKDWLEQMQIAKAVQEKPQHTLH